VFIAFRNFDRAFERELPYPYSPLLLIVTPTPSIKILAYVGDFILVSRGRNPAAKFPKIINPVDKVANSFDFIL